MIRVARRRHDGELARTPVEVAFLDDEAAHGITMTTESLRSTVHNNIGTMLEGAHQVGRSRSVVNDEWQAVLVRDFCPPLQVDDKASWIGDRLAVKRLGLRRDGFLDTCEVVRWAEGDVPPE